MGYVKKKKVDEVEKPQEPQEPTPEAVDAPTGRFTQITYSRTRQVAQYEPEKIEVVCTIAEGEDIEEVFNDTKAMVEYLLYKEDE